MNAATESKFKPFESPASRDFSDAKVTSPDANKAVDGGAPDKASFRDVLLNSNDDTAKERAAQKNGDQLRMAKSDDEFAKMMAAKANQGNLRKPQNELDKDAFLKLFVTQMRNQDPMSPDNSSQMAAQLAQFHGLEQMMNVNKNLEKMQSEEALGRAVTLLNFVGKEIKLDNGKLQIEGGKLITEASFKLENEASKTALEIRDGAGVVVATKDLGHRMAGDSKLDWSGLNKTGKPLTDGAYTFSIQATDMQGQPMNVPITSTLQVSGVDLHEGGGSFYTAVGKVGIREVGSVGATGYGRSSKGAGEAVPAGDLLPGELNGNSMNGANGANGANSMNSATGANGQGFPSGSNGANGASNLNNANNANSANGANGPGGPNAESNAGSQGGAGASKRLPVAANAQAAEAGEKSATQPMPRSMPPVTVEKPAPMASKADKSAPAKASRT